MEKITLSDGTSFLNPYYDPKAEAAQNTSPASTNPYRSSPYSMEPIQGDFGPSSYGGGLTQGADPMALWQQQGHLLEVLDIPEIPIATKLYLSANIAQILASPDSKYVLPSPIDKREGIREKTLSGRAIINSLKQVFHDEKRMTDLLGRAQPQVKALEKQIEAARVLHDQQVAREEEAQRSLNESQKTNETNQRVQYARVNRLFDHAKKELISLATRGKSPSVWSEAEKTIVAKIEPISLKLASLGSREYNLGNCSYGQVASSHPEQVVIACPVIFDSPTPALLWLLAHEMSHQISPCEFTMPLWEINQIKLDEFIKNNQLTEQDLSSLKPSGGG